MVHGRAVLASKMLLERAGVAIGTVSNVLNNPGVVTEQTRLKVEAAIAELGFVRNSAVEPSPQEEPIPSA